MSSTAAIDRPVFESATWLRDLVRRNKQDGEPVGQEPKDVPPFMPESAFVLPDGEVIECEAQS